MDVSSAIDFGTLCRYMSDKPEIIPYTSTRVHDFRKGKFIMRTYNHLFKIVARCDGFKTGYFIKAGFSIAATEQRGGKGIITVVMSR